MSKIGISRDANVTKDIAKNNFRLGFPCSPAWEPRRGRSSVPEPQSGSGGIPTQVIGTIGLEVGKLLLTVS